MNRHYEAVIFDLDGTLIDSMWLWEKVDETYLGRLGLTPPSDMESELEGMSFTETAEYFKQRFHIQDSVEKIKEDWKDIAWRYYTQEVGLKPGVRRFLEYLKKQQIKIGIATSNTHILVAAVLEKLEINTYFESIRTSCEVEKGKPHPYIYIKVAEDLKVLPEKCLVFEDVPNGALAAINAGMDVWGIHDRQTEEVRQVLKELTTQVIWDYEEVMTYFEYEEQKSLG